MKIYLASASPTRKKLLQEILAPMGLSSKVMVSEVDEELEKIEKITRRETERLVVKLAKEKAKRVFEQLKDRKKDLLIIAADTLIWFDNKIYGKPRDLADAYATLSLFRGRIHWAFTGLVLRFSSSVILRPSRQGNTSEVTLSGVERGSSDGGGIGDEEIAICAKAKVYMKKISDERLQEYVDSQEPLGKAGSYAILQKAAPLFKVLQGEPSTVAGLPVKKLKSLLKEFARLE